MESKFSNALALILGSVFPGYSGDGHSNLAAVEAIARLLRSKGSANRDWIVLKEAKMRPIVAAFDVVDRKDMYSLKGGSGIGDNGALKVCWELDVQNDWHLYHVGIYSMSASQDTDIRYSVTRQEYEVWSEGAATGELMARGLYRLGFDEAVLTQLPPLSAHKRLELRLSLPREFWPQKWLDESNGSEHSPIA